MLALYLDELISENRELDLVLRVVSLQVNGTVSDQIDGLKPLAPILKPLLPPLMQVPFHHAVPVRTFLCRNVVEHRERIVPASHNGGAHAAVDRVGEGPGTAGDVDADAQG